MQIIIITPLNIFIGRSIGPANYGEYSFILSVSSILSVFMIFGQQSALINYLSAGIDDERRKIVSSNLILLSITIILTIFLFVFFSKYYDIGTLKLILIVMHAILLVMIAINQSIYQSMLKFNTIGFFKILFPVVFSIGILLYYIFNEYGNSYSIVLIRSLAIFISIIYFIFIWMRKYFSFQDISFKKLYMLFRYGLHGLFITAVITIVLQSDKLFIDKYLSNTILGYYQAYFNATITLFQFFAMLSAIIFFPIFKRKSYIDRMSIINKLIVYSPVMMVFGILFTPISSIIISLYGSEYPLSWKILLLMNISGVIIVLHSLLSRAVLSNDIAGARIAAINTIISASTYFLIIYFGISHFKLYGVIAAILGYNLVGVLVNYSAIRKLNYK